MSFSFNFDWDWYPLTSFLPHTEGNSRTTNVSVTVYPIWYKQITLEWTIPASFGSCTFNVYKSEIEDGDFAKLNSTPIVGNTFKDTTTRQFSKYDESWYKVEAVTSDGKRIQSHPTTWVNSRNPWVELRAIEVQRRAWLLLTKFVGVRCYVLRRKTYGQRCKECWDFHLEKVMKDKCETCLGTSFEGGYFKAVDTYLQFESSPKNLTKEYFGTFEDGNTSAWTISFPELNPRDLVYKVTDGSMYSVDATTSTELQGSPVRQIFKLTELDTESPEYLAVRKFALLPSEITN